MRQVPEGTKENNIPADRCLDRFDLSEIPMFLVKSQKSKIALVCRPAGDRLQY